MTTPHRRYKIAGFSDQVMEAGEMICNAATKVDRDLLEPNYNNEKEIPVSQRILISSIMDVAQEIHQCDIITELATFRSRIEEIYQDAKKINYTGREFVFAHFVDVPAYNEAQYARLMRNTNASRALIQSMFVETYEATEIQTWRIAYFANRLTRYNHGLKEFMRMAAYALFRGTKMETAIKAGNFVLNPDFENKLAPPVTEPKRIRKDLPVPKYMKRVLATVQAK